GNFWIPIVEGAEKSEKDAADNHIVKVGDDKVRTAQLPVKGGGSQHDAGEPSDQELEEKANAEKHGSFEDKFPAPHGAEPVENLDACWDPHGHRGDGKKGVCVRCHSDREHMVGPDTHADKSNAHGCSDHHRITKNRLARE